MKNSEHNINFIITNLIILLVFGLIFFIQSGRMSEIPEVSAKPDNCYDETLVVITDADYRPYSFSDVKGHDSGHDVELMIMIANELHMNLDLRLMEWNEGIAEINAGNADVLMTCDYTDSFAGVENLLKSEPVSIDDFIVYSKTKITTSDTLYGKRIGIMRNGNVTTEINKMDLFKYCVLYDDNRKAMIGLINDEVDYVIMRQTVGTVLLDELGARGIKGYVSIGRSDMCFGINPEKPELVDEINQAIETLRMNGQCEMLRDKWLTTFVKPYTFKEILINNIWIPFAFVFVVMVAVWFSARNVISKKELEKDEYRNSRVIEKLASDFECVNYITLTPSAETDPLVNYRVSEKLAGLIPGWEEEKYFTRKMLRLCENVVFEPDRETFLEESKRENVLKAFETSDAYYVRLRLFMQGETYYYQLKFSPVYEDETIVGVVAGLNSVDEETRKELAMQAQLEDALNKADASSKSKTEFLFNMSHDIRTPMNAIIGFNKMALKNLDDKDKVRDSLIKTGKASSMLLTLINSILDMSRIESGKAVLEERNADIYESFDNIESTMIELASSKDIDLSFRIGPVRDRFVMADYDRTTRVFTNIITNAIKYTKAGGHVSAYVEQVGEATDGVGTYRYTIKDDGIGMSEEFQEHLFDKFSREENTTMSGVQGTGLGLSVVKSFVELMGGTIECISKRGEGSTFIVTLPFKLQKGTQFGKFGEKDYFSEWNDVDGDTKSISGNAYSDRKEKLKGKRTLLCEDNELNREIACDLLSEQGIIVEEAENGQMAVDLLKEKGPEYYDFILMDIQMPIMDGYTATQEIRKMYPDSPIIIIALSANAFAEDRKASLEVGMDEHVAKPINPDNLFEVLSNHL